MVSSLLKLIHSIPGFPPPLRQQTQAGYYTSRSSLLSFLLSVWKVESLQAEVQYMRVCFYLLFDSTPKRYSYTCTCTVLVNIRKPPRSQGQNSLLYYFIPIVANTGCYTERRGRQQFYNWGLGTEQERSCRTSSLAYVAWRGPVRQPCSNSVPKAPTDCTKKRKQSGVASADC